MTPEVAKAREAWLTTYVGAKHLARSVLVQRGQLDRLPEIFDDLAEVHRVTGVSDE